jgi:hypothetical protein
VTQTRTPADLTVTPRGEHPCPSQLIMINQNSLGVAALSYLVFRDGTAAQSQKQASVTQEVINRANVA